MSNKQVTSKLEKIVEMRGAVAHTGRLPENAVLPLALVRDYVRFIEKLAGKLVARVVASRGRGRRELIVTYEVLDLVLSGLSLVAIAFVVLQITTHNRQMHHDFEAIYLQRFWSLTERRWVDLASPRARRLSSADQRLVHDYLTLSNDQVELRRHGRITDRRRGGSGPPGYSGVCFTSNSRAGTE